MEGTGVKEAIHISWWLTSEERIEERSGSLQGHVTNDLIYYSSALHSFLHYSLVPWAGEMGLWGTGEIQTNSVYLVSHRLGLQRQETIGETLKSSCLTTAPHQEGSGQLRWESTPWHMQAIVYCFFSRLPSVERYITGESKQHVTLHRSFFTAHYIF